MTVHAGKGDNCSSTQGMWQQQAQGGAKPDHGEKSPGRTDSPPGCAPGAESANAFYPRKAGDKRPTDRRARRPAFDNPSPHPLKMQRTFQTFHQSHSNTDSMQKQSTRRRSLTLPTFTHRPSSRATVCPLQWFQALLTGAQLSAEKLPMSGCRQGSCTSV